MPRYLQPSKSPSLPDWVRKLPDWVHNLGNEISVNPVASNLITKPLDKSALLLRDRFFRPIQSDNINSAVEHWAGRQPATARQIGAVTDTSFSPNWFDVMQKEFPDYSAFSAILPEAQGMLEKGSRGLERLKKINEPFHYLGINPKMENAGYGNLLDTVGEEFAHTAQSALNPLKFQKAYARASRDLGYDLNPFENAAKASAYKKSFTTPDEDLVEHFLSSRLQEAPGIQPLYGWQSVPNSWDKGYKRTITLMKDKFGRSPESYKDFNDMLGQYMRYRTGGLSSIGGKK